MTLCSRCKRALPSGAASCPECRAASPPAVRPRPAAGPVRAPAPKPAGPAQPPGWGASPSPAPPREVVAWLVCRWFPPFPVSPGAEVVMGRADDCGLILAHTAISRRHALLRAEGDQLTLTDPGSANGTFVNSRRIGPQPVVLQVGDTIDVGPFKIKVSSASRPTRPSGRFDLADTTELVRGPDSELSGRLGKVGLAEIFQVIELFEKTGTLSVVSREARGELVVVQGKPASARFGKAVDEAAVQAMLRLHAGTFEFLASVDERVKTTMSATLGGLLMEAARVDDEFRRSRAPVVEAEASSFFGLEGLFAFGAQAPGFAGEKTQVLSRQGPCPACGQVIDRLGLACPRCGVALRPPAPGPPTP